MFKRDMTDTQIKDKDSFLHTLTKAGWDIGSWDTLLESNLIEVSPEARAEFENDAANLILEYHARERYVSLFVGTKQANDSVKFRFYYGDRLEEVLATALAYQGTVSPKNFIDVIKAVIPLCEEALCELDENRRVKLSLDA